MSKTRQGKTKIGKSRGAQPLGTLFRIFGMEPLEKVTQKLLFFVMRIKAKIERRVTHLGGRVLVIQNTIS